MEDIPSEADILVRAPCNAGKKERWSKAGLRPPNLWATSLVMRKYGSWSIAQGIKQGTVLLSPKMKGKELLNEGAAWIAGNAILPIVQESSNPKIPLTWL